ncbi:MAG: hypothetical protein ACKVP2_00275 [Burkholderiales bacterium]
MSSQRKFAVRNGFAVVSLISAAGLFVFTCFTAASDAQGAILFIFTGPVILALLAVSVVLGALARSTGGGRILLWISGASALFVTSFFLASLHPALRAFPEAVIDGVASAYQAITGESPYTSAHKSHDVMGMLRGELAFSNGARLDISRLRTRRDWDRVCVLGPYTNASAAREVLGARDWNSELFSRIAVSDVISTLVFLANEKISYVVEVPRQEADFANLSRQCYPREAAIFARLPGSSPAFAPAVR